MVWKKGQVAHNKLNRVDKRYGKLTVLKEESSGRWLCVCDCGNEVSVLSTNLSYMEKNHGGCRSCSNRKNILNKRVGQIIAVGCEVGPIIGRHPLWLFQCDCGNTIQGTVREFNAGWLRSCGCAGNVHSSWTAMLARCYNKKNNRYQHYGGRGIRVCKRWHKFENFLADMGERPKRYTLSRTNCERDYKPSNCCWEHVTKNTADTCFGRPTRPGLKKGAKQRK